MNLGIRIMDTQTPEKSGYRRVKNDRLRGCEKEKSPLNLKKSKPVIPVDEKLLQSAMHEQWHDRYWQSENEIHELVRIVRHAQGMAKRFCINTFCTRSF